ncbi:MAG: glycosyltransferase family 2 protein [Calditrichaeota bacterium]|nr:glycosyltransferase family 2 protein [Calditrichota bacterium]
MTKMAKEICAIIPAFNAEKTIGAVIRGVNRYLPPEQIVVVNDGSADATETIARKQGAVVLNNGKNRGKGFSLRRGFHFAIENNFSAALCIDADMQHDPADIPKFLACFNQTDADLILGSRIHNLKDMPLDRQFSNQTTSLLISLLTGVRVRDSQSGYRLIKTSVLKKIILHSNRYETESELLVKTLKSGFRVTHVPIKTIYNQAPSHIHRLRDTIRFLIVVGRSLYSKT